MYDARRNTTEDEHSAQKCPKYVSNTKKTHLEGNELLLNEVTNDTPRNKTIKIYQLRIQYYVVLLNMIINTIIWIVIPKSASRAQVEECIYTVPTLRTLIISESPLI